MSTATLAVPTDRLSGTKRGETAIDKDGRVLGQITKRISTFLYLDNGDRIALHNLRTTRPVEPGVTLYEFPDGSYRLATLEEWLEA